jgi:hypothetical protein
MGIEVDQYRESIGKYYTVARSVKKGKLLSITDNKKHHVRGERCDAKLKCELNKEICRQ